MGEWVSDRLVGWVGGWGMGGVQVSTWVKKKNIIWYIQWVLEKKIKSDMILCFFSLASLFLQPCHHIRKTSPGTCILTSPNWNAIGSIFGYWPLRGLGTT